MGKYFRRESGKRKTIVQIEGLGGGRSEKSKWNAGGWSFEFRKGKI